jgi:1-acyl-sn-glycerol-3-phosphate acyltransferase
MQLIRSIIFNASIYVAMPVLAIVYAPYALVSRDGAFAAAHAWCRYVRWAARVICNLRTEIRGVPPTDEVLIAAKHQSFLDIILIFSAVPRGKFIMKRELVWAPILGLYALRMGCVPVARGKRGAAIDKMKRDVAKGTAEPGQLIIYPQGTRVAVDAVKPYKKGSGILYEQLGQPCVPVATNVGHFWPRRGFLRKPGTAVVEFGERIPPGLSVRAFMERLEEEVERESQRLLEEARS